MRSHSDTRASILNSAQVRLKFMALVFFYDIWYLCIFISGGAWQVDYVRQTGFKGVKELIPIRSVPLISLRLLGCSIIQN